VKTLQRLDGHFWLMPHNPAYQPIPADDATILGKVVAFVRPAWARPLGGQRDPGGGAGNGGQRGAHHPGDGPQHRIVPVPAPLAELVPDRDYQHRHDDDQDLGTDEPGALRDEGERRAGHHEQQGG
jgi:hypothetical protein